MREKGEHVAMVTYHGGGEAVAVGGNDSALAACKQLTTVRHPGAASHLMRNRRDRDENTKTVEEDGTEYSAEGAVDFYI